MEAEISSNLLKVNYNFYQSNFRRNIFSLTFLIITIFLGVADKVSLQVSVSALRVAVVGAEFEVGGEERAGVVAGASEE